MSPKYEIQCFYQTPPHEENILQSIHKTNKVIILIFDCICHKYLIISDDK